MNWKKEAVNLLKDFPAKQEALTNISKRYEMLDFETKNSCEKIPLKGSLSDEQEYLFNSMAEKKLLKNNLTLVQQEVDLVNNALSSLSEPERRILEGFYIKESKFGKDDLMDEFCVERSRLYELKEQALRKFTLTMYGFLES